MKQAIRLSCDDYCEVLLNSGVVQYIKILRLFKSLSRIMAHKSRDVLSKHA